MRMVESAGAERSLRRSPVARLSSECANPYPCPPRVRTLEDWEERTGRRLRKQGCTYKTLCTGLPQPNAARGGSTVGHKRRQACERVLEAAAEHAHGEVQPLESREERRGEARRTEVGHVDAVDAAHRQLRFFPVPRAQ